MAMYSKLLTMTKKCLHCNNVFSKPQNESVRAFNERHIYCSKKCMVEHKPKVSLVCWECEGHFTVKNYRKETAHFCSKECSWQYRDEGKRTADKKIRQSWAYIAWRTLVF